MLVLSESNSYQFSNMVVRVIDETGLTDDTVTPTPEVPRFNILIPTVQAVGVTNTVELYHPGEPNRYILAHGTPNALKYGFGPDFIYEILSHQNSGVGVYTVNLRGDSATVSNVVCKALYKIEKDVPYTDTEGNQYYVTASGELTDEPTDNTPVVRDVLKLKFVTETVPNIKKWVDLHKYLNSIYSNTEDDNGYKCIPWFGVMYRGASSYANNSYFSMAPSKAEYDGNMYYAVKLFDGANVVSSDSTFSMDVNSGVKYNTSYYMENMFNNKFTNFRYMTAEYSTELVDLINKYLYTVDDYLSGKTATPSVRFPEVDAFNLNTFGIQMEADTVNTLVANAFQLASGTDGTETPDELFESFFKGDIITDIASVVRYRINYIVDTGYNDATKKEIINLVNKRSRMTTATLMVGGADTFSSALIDHQANYFNTMPNVRQLTTVQSPMMYNEFVRRTMTYPSTFFDVRALMNHFEKWTHYYQPFAGADARWTGFIEDTMVYPAETVDTVNSLYTNRINVVMKDAQPGAYLTDQLMNTVLTSDQTELNNAFLISNMLYDLVNLVHYNHFKFNEAEEVRQFTEAVNDGINTEYSQYSAALSVEVWRVGTVGRAKSANKIKVSIDLKDINKFTDVDIYLTDG